MSSRHVVGILVVAMSILAMALVSHAGPLDPPAGPVTPTYKTLAEVEPRVAVNGINTPGDADSLFKISQPGSYYLVANIAGTAGKHGIEIVAAGVTLDLNGFDVVGAAGSLDGISVSVPNLNNIVIANGSIRSWSHDGIDLGTQGATSCRVMNVTSSRNTATGIYVGSCNTVSHCTSFNNNGTGIVASTGTVISDCSVYNNLSGGIFTSFGCTISVCTVYFNSVGGISADGSTTITNCTAHGNVGPGISAGLNGSSVIGCTASFNNNLGIKAGTGCSVTSCTVQNNTLDGIMIGTACCVYANTCSNNGNGGDGAGIHATGSKNRIENNNCSGADRGVGIDIGGNVIIKNTCSGNATNWLIAANNVCGPILDRTAPGSAAISGNSGSSSLGSTEPNANFTY